MKHQALIYGTIAIDTLCTPHGTAACELGGSGSFAALAARLVSRRIKLLGIVGTDFPLGFERALKRHRVGLRHVQKSAGRTFAWTARYEDDMNQRETLETVEGVQEFWQMKLTRSLQNSSVVAACNVTPRLQSQLLAQCSPQSFTMADFMKSWIERERDYVDSLLARVDMAFMNDEEAHAFAGTDDAAAAGEALLDSGPRFVIIKHGSEGSSLLMRESDGRKRQYDCPAWPLKKAVDPTGAGDAYMGAMAAWICEHLRAKRSLRWDDVCAGMHLAATIAAAVCESFGTHALLACTRKQIESRLKKIAFK